LLCSSVYSGSAHLYLQALLIWILRLCSSVSSYFILLYFPLFLYTVMLFLQLPVLKDMFWHDF
jgi:hypothetical protein